MSKAVVRISVNAEQPDHREPRPAHPQPEAVRRREEEREEEDVGRADVGRPVLAGQPERDRDAVEQARLLRDDVVGRPAPHRERVDPGDDHRDSTTQESASKSCMNRKPTAVSASSFATLKSDPIPARSSRTRQHCRERPRAGGRPRASAAGRTSHGTAKVSGSTHERHDEDVRPAADVGQHAGPGIPGDERRDDGCEGRSPCRAAQYGGSSRPPRAPAP